MRPERAALLQLAPQHFAHVALRQLVEELDVARNLVAGQIRARVRDDAASVSFGSLRTTNSFTTSPDCLSGTPTAATSRTPGWLAATSSISFG